MTYGCGDIKKGPAAAYEAWRMKMFSVGHFTHDPYPTGEDEKPASILARLISNLKRVFQ